MVTLSFFFHTGHAQKILTLASMENLLENAGTRVKKGALVDQLCGMNSYEAGVCSSQIPFRSVTRAHKSVSSHGFDCSCSGTTYV